jgi:biotin carboxyl carrier protein
MDWYLKSVGADISIWVDLSQHLRSRKTGRSRYYLEGPPPDNQCGLEHPRIRSFTQRNVATAAEQHSQIPADQDAGALAFTGEPESELTGAVSHPHANPGSRVSEGQELLD